MQETPIAKASKAGEFQTFGSFFLDGAEFVMNVNFIQEVVNAPDKFIQMPLAPSYLRGLFNLRGSILPVIDLRELLKLNEGVPAASTSQIAVIDYEGITVGFLLDSTGEVLRIPKSEINEFSYASHEKAPVVAGAIKLDNGQRLLQILSPSALVTIENIPQILEQQNGSGRARQKLLRGKRRKCISFTTGAAHLAFEIVGIHEIVRVPEIRHSALQSDLCQGLVTIRGQIIPIIDFARLLGSTAVTDSTAADARIITLQLADAHVGLLVDSVESIDSYYADDIIPFPLLGKERAAMFQGCVTVPDIGDVILLNHDKVLSNEEIVRLTKGHSQLYKGDAERDAAKKKGGNRQSYISFTLNTLFGVPILGVKEIIKLSDDLLSAPGTPEAVLGLLNLRGDLIPIIDTKRLFALPDSASENNRSEKKILIIQHQDQKFGLVVDEVESILTIDENNKMALPTIFHREQTSTFANIIKEVVQLDGEPRKAMVILDLAQIVNKIHGPQSSRKETVIIEQDDAVPSLSQDFQCEKPAHTPVTI